MSAKHAEFSKRYQARKHRGKWVLAIALSALALGMGLGIDYMLRDRSSAAKAAGDADRNHGAAAMQTAAVVAETAPPPVQDIQSGDSPGRMSEVGQRGSVPLSDPRTSAGREPAEPFGEKYFVQVAAVPDLQEAQFLLEQVSGARYPAYLIPTDINNVRLYRVRVGPFRSWHAAQEAARRLTRDGHGDPWITK